MSRQFEAMHAPFAYGRDTTRPVALSGFRTARKRRWEFGAISAAVIWLFAATTPLLGQAVVLDGSLGGDPYKSLCLQRTQTAAGDSTLGQADLCDGSELAEAYGVIVDDTLYLLITGNLKSDFSKLELFFDSIPAAGQNQIRNDNPVIDGDALNNMAGMRFAQGFAPDFWIGVSGGDTGDGYHLLANFARLSASGDPGFSNYLGRTTAVSDGVLSGGSNPDDIRVTIDNSNIDGVEAGVCGGCPCGAETGVELAIPLSALGAPSGPIMVYAILNSPTHQSLSNQALGGLGCSEPLESPSGVDLEALESYPFTLEHAGPPPGEFNVTGYVYAPLSDGQGGERLVDLPGVSLRLHDVNSGQDSTPAISDGRGRFQIDVNAGSYQLCWSGAGVVPDCSATIITVTDRDVALGDVPVQLVPCVLYGKVTLMDGSPLGDQQPTTNSAIIRPRVTLSDDPSPPFAECGLNVHGEYVLAGVPAGSHTLRIETDVELWSESVQCGAGPHDVPIANSPPTIQIVYASQNGVGTRYPTPGSTVQVTVEASDPDGDPLHYEWRSNTPEDGFVSSDAASVSWTLTDDESMHVMYVRVSDGMGGSAIDRVELNTTYGGPQFSGHVEDPQTQPITGAIVSVNGIVAISDDDGYFEVNVPEAPRYTVNISASGYQTLNEVSHVRQVGRRYVMSPVTTTDFDPGIELQVTEVIASPWSKFDECLWGPDNPLLPTPPTTADDCLLSFDREPDTDVDLRDLAALQPQGCNTGPAQVIIPAGALRGPQGQMPSGQLHLYLSTISQGDTETNLPGDGSGVNAQNEPIVMEQSFGAIEVLILDDAGQRYNLAPGYTATLRIPIRCDDAGSAPSTITLSYYDEESGLWIEDGVATRNGNYYECQVSHFTVFNVGGNNGPQTLVRVILNIPRIPGARTYKGNNTAGRLIYTTTFVEAEYLIRVFQQVPNAAEKEIALPDNGILNERVNEVRGLQAGFAYRFSLSKRDRGAREEFSATTPALNQVGGLNGLGYPFTDPNVPTVSLGVSPEAADRTGKFLAEKGKDDSITAEEYYAAIDPKEECFRGVVAKNINPGDESDQITGPDRTRIGAGDIIRFYVPDPQTKTDKIFHRMVKTVDNQNRYTLHTKIRLPAAGVSFKLIGTRSRLSFWKNINGYGNNNPAIVKAAYFNAGDLGFGRAMFMKKAANANDSDTAFYVSNYRTVDEALADVNNNRQAGLLATVCMEFRKPIKPDGSTDNAGTRFTTFYVYNGNGVRVPDADLDGLGAKYIPALCIDCHGGTRSTVADGRRYPSGGDVDATFLPFDLHSFVYAADDNLVRNQFKAGSRGAQNSAFTALNSAVRERVNAPDDLKDLINGWAGGHIPQGTGDEYLPVDWYHVVRGKVDQDRKNLYFNVVRESCRTCHVVLPTSFHTFTSFDDNKAGITTRVCTDRSMPNAVVTWENFWLDAKQLKTLKDRGIVGADCAAP